MSKQPPSSQKKIKELLRVVLGRKPRQILCYNLNTKWKSLLSDELLMLPDQHVIGGCNQIISLRFGFPNSFPMVLSTDQSLAFKKKGSGRGGKENNHTRNLYRGEREGNDLIEEEKRKGKSGVLLYFAPSTYRSRWVSPALLRTPVLW